MEAKSKRAEISEPLLPPPVGNEPLLPPPMMSQGYKSTTDHEEEEEDSEDHAGRPEKDYRPPNASRSRSGSMSRLPPRAANPTLDFGTARRPSAAQLETRKARQHFNRQQRRQSGNGVGSPRHKPAAWPQRVSMADDPEASRCTSYCCAHTLELVGVDRWLHTLSQQGNWYKDGLNAVLHCEMSSHAAEELCRSAPNPTAFSPNRRWPTGERIPRGEVAVPSASAAPGPHRSISLPGQPGAESDGLELEDVREDEDEEVEQPAHAFFFSYGCVVLWGISEELELSLVAILQKHYAQEPLLTNEVDDFGYVHALGSERMMLHKDLIKLSTFEVGEKLAASFALAQSAKLGFFECTVQRTISHISPEPLPHLLTSTPTSQPQHHRHPHPHPHRRRHRHRHPHLHPTQVEKTIQDTRSIPERMARDGKVSLGRKQITMQLGQLFVDRASINLHSDILDNPDYFWEDDEWLPAYARVAKYLEITRRAEVLNKRLDIIKELFDMLASEYHNSHASMLEWIIIVLIVIEVFFQVVSLCLDGTTGI